MKYLIKYKLFEEHNDSFKYENGCIMLELPIEGWDEVLCSIDEDDIYDEESTKMPFGLQENPHLTLLYTVKKTIKYDFVKRKLDQIVNKDEPINISINTIEVFESGNYDILVFRVDDNEYLTKIHEHLKRTIPNYNVHKDFKLHITIGYLKKGTGDKYRRKFNLDINNIKEITYTTKTEKDIYEIY